MSTTLFEVIDTRLTRDAKYRPWIIFLDGSMRRWESDTAQEGIDFLRRTHKTNWFGGIVAYGMEEQDGKDWVEWHDAWGTDSTEYVEGELNMSTIDV